MSITSTTRHARRSRGKRIPVNVGEDITAPLAVASDGLVGTLAVAESGGGYGSATVTTTAAPDARGGGKTVDARLRNIGMKVKDVQAEGDYFVEVGGRPSRSEPEILLGHQRREVRGAIEEAVEVGRELESPIDAVEPRRDAWQRALQIALEVAARGLQIDGTRHEHRIVRVTDQMGEDAEVLDGEIHRLVASNHHHDRACLALDALAQIRTVNRTLVRKRELQSVREVFVVTLNHQPKIGWRETRAHLRNAPIAGMRPCTGRQRDECESEEQASH